MRYCEIILQPRLLRLCDAEAYVGGECNLRALVKVGWVKPLIQHKSNTTYDRESLDTACSRANIEGWPA